jgi:hypothetical protein
MFCNICYGQKIVIRDRRPIVCPECHGLGLSCCEGTERELDHQPTKAESKPVSHPAAFLTSWSIPVRGQRRQQIRNSLRA